MFNSDSAKSLAVIVLGVVAVCNVLTNGVDTITIAIVGFIGGILVSKT